jgi:hypothetical protein
MLSRILSILFFYHAVPPVAVPDFFYPVPLVTVPDLFLPCPSCHYLFIFSVMVH